MDELTAMMARSGLRETEVTADAALAGAAAGLSMQNPYCHHMASAVVRAVGAATDPSREQPQNNAWTVFCDTWHASSLARLSDADLANAWRLAEYLLLDND